MAMGASVFRIRIALIFRRCWNLITPCDDPQVLPPPMSGVPRILGRGFRWRELRSILMRRLFSGNDLHA
jgi:hypothetical protein